MARLIAALIRHGEYRQLPDTPSAHQPFPLSAEGEADAREAGRLIEVYCRQLGCSLVPVIDSSNMLRAWQTAIDIAAESGLSASCVESFDALAERGLGCAANLSIDQIEEVLKLDPRYAAPPPDWKSNSHYRLPLQGAESLLEAGERVAAHLLDRMRALRNQVTEDSLKLFVGHGAAFRHAAYQLGVLEFEEIAKLSMYHGRPVLLEFLPGDRWQHVAGEWKVRQSLDIPLD